MSVRKLDIEPTQSEPEPILDKEAWHDVVKMAVDEARATDTPLAVIFIDVNNFKEINDNLGHQAGDEVITGIREMLKKQLRLTEKRPKNERDQMWVQEAEQPRFYRGKEPEGLEVGHIGGDEFGILCKTDDIGTKTIEKRLRAAFSEHMSSQDEKLQALDIGLAIGVSVLQPEMTTRELLHLADQEMYNDKWNQLPPLNEEQEKFLTQFYEALEQQKIRLRDLGKYAILLARKSENLTE